MPGFKMILLNAPEMGVLLLLCFDFGKMRILACLPVTLMIEWLRGDESSFFIENSFEDPP